MNQAGKWAAIGLAGATFFAIVVMIGIYVASARIINRTYPLPASHIHAAHDPVALARGHALALGYGCGDCHRKTFQGTYIPDFGVSSRNLTRLAKAYSDADLDRAIRHGLRPDGTSVAEYMPSDALQFIPDADLAEIIGYLCSLKPAGEDVGVPRFGVLARAGFLTGALHTDRYWFGIQKPALDLGPRFARGRALAMAACGECHMTALNGPPEGMSGPGPRPPDLMLVASYERADFFKLMRTGKAAGNRELPMMSGVARIRFSHFPDADLNAIYDYLVARGRKLTASPS